MDGAKPNVSKQQVQETSSASDAAGGGRGGSRPGGDAIKGLAGLGDKISGQVKGGASAQDALQGVKAARGMTSGMAGKGDRPEKGGSSEKGGLSGKGSGGLAGLAGLGDRIRSEVEGKVPKAEDLTAKVDGIVKEAKATAGKAAPTAPPADAPAPAPAPGAEDPAAAPTGGEANAPAAEKPARGTKGRRGPKSDKPAPAPAPTAGPDTAPADAPSAGGSAPTVPPGTPMPQGSAAGGGAPGPADPRAADAVGKLVQTPAGKQVAELAGDVPIQVVPASDPRLPGTGDFEGRYEGGELLVSDAAVADPAIGAQIIGHELLHAVQDQQGQSLAGDGGEADAYALQDTIAGELGLDPLVHGSGDAGAG